MIEINRNGSFTIPPEDCFIGYTADNNRLTKSFHIDSLTDISLNFKLILRFENGVENYFLLEEEINGCGTILEWSLSNDKFYYRGLAQIQIQGSNGSGIVFKSDFINIYIDNAIKFINTSADLDAIYNLSA